MWTLRTPLGDWFDREKRGLFRTVRPFTLASYRRLSNVYDLCREAARSQVPGAFAECGVWRGGAGAVMAAVARAAGSSRITWLFDSFEGLPAPTATDGSEAPRYAGESPCWTDAPT